MTFTGPGVALSHNHLLVAYTAVCEQSQRCVTVLHEQVGMGD